MSTEEMIKQAFDKQAGQAGDHRGVLAEVARRTSSRRRIGVVGIAVATGVVAAVVTPALLFTGGGEPLSVEPAAPPAAVVPPGTPVLKYVPGWLPEEMVEDLREVLADGSLVRGWSVPGTGTGTDNSGGQEVELKFEKSSKLSPAGMRIGTQAVEVNGNRGQVSGHDGSQPGQGFAEWLVGNEGKLTLRVEGMPDARELALSIARSVRADSDAAFLRPITFGWLPAGFTPGPYQVRGTSKPYLIAETMVDESFKGPFAIFVEVGSDKPDGSGVPVTVRGREGVYNNQAGAGMKGEIWAPIEGGKWLKVSGSLAKDDLVKVADGLTFMDNPKFTWLGR